MSEPENPARDATGESAPAPPRAPAQAEPLDPRGRDLPSRLRAVAAGAGPQPQPQPAEARRPTLMPTPEILPSRGSVSGSASTSLGRALPPQSRLTGMQRAMHGLRAALPIVQKVLPLLEGQVFTTLSNLLAPHPLAPPPTDISPLEGSLADLKTRHMELFNRLGEQSSALKRVAERLDLVQAAADRNALEQKELRTSLQSVSRRSNVIAIVALCLLALSLGANLFLFLHFQRLAR